jgi:hypothetical protein
MRYKLGPARDIFIAVFGSIKHQGLYKIMMVGREIYLPSKSFDEPRREMRPSRMALNSWVQPKPISQTLRDLAMDARRSLLIYRADKILSRP